METKTNAKKIMLLVKGDYYVGQAALKERGIDACEIKQVKDCTLWEMEADQAGLTPDCIWQWHDEYDTGPGSLIHFYFQPNERW
jgi:hypothetical protein